jgi:hypothetical protein
VGQCNVPAPNSGFIAIAGGSFFSLALRADNTPINPADMNCDGLIDGVDIGPFVTALLDPAGYDSAYPNCSILNGDLDDDAQVTLADVTGMVDCLLSASCP